VRKRYRQFCGLAIAMEIVGERWTALILRELLFGPRRYSDILADLRGIAPNLLASRLREMELDGVVQRGALPPPAASAIYELTAEGRALAEALAPLALWGIRRLGKMRADLFPARGLLMALQAGFDPARAAGVRETYEVNTPGSIFQATVDDGRLVMREGKGPEHPNLVIAGDLRTLIAAGLGRLGPGAGSARAPLSVEGDPAALGRFREIFLGRFSAPVEVPAPDGSGGAPDAPQRRRPARTRRRTISRR